MGKLDKVRRAIAQEIGKEKIAEAAAIAEPAKSAPGADAVPGAPPRLTKEGILLLVEMPFSAARMVTGSESYRIGPAIRDEIGERGLQLAKDYGIEFAAKQMNLMMFVVLYGGAFIGATAGYLKELKDVKNKTQAKHPGQGSGPGPGPKREDDAPQGAPAWN